MDPVTEIELRAIHAFVSARIPYTSRVARLMRTTTEAFHFSGRYYASTLAKGINLTISRHAAELMAVSNRAEFSKGTILEHMLPLKAMYAEMLTLGSQVSFEQIVSYFTDTLQKCPLVTVTKEEDRRLRNDLPHPERYPAAGIEIGSLDAMTFGSMPRWTPLKREDLIVPGNPEVEGEADFEPVQAARRGHLSWGAGDLEFE
ncbi:MULTISPECIES: hypothetical protein [unclassified Mesorhizobium]|uniref:hypothetical protein n=1 Tax=unclassified Mesorhizobium TaxID=325217 RepID=UPI0003CEF2C2|nr:MULTISPECIES: hypothetical protein [unclassified Mesorhizobium]ESW66767.1 hypothetical protein X771_16735 [Mesorhizobium sp. LSJC277A00]ESX63547.1 hypothetical protein X760_01110 [Mesorhizobium sp. LSHC422A00]ESY22412.1 hypothetical protein X751_07125 [Mesorhizobium sp. LNJC395A00]WJI72608.1 hypothetical protein NLY37_16270 [Mesorhizobium sp. C395A]